MCGRFVQYSDPEVYAERFDLELSPSLRAEWRPRFNLAPTQRVLAIRADADGHRTLVPLRWGLIPFWSKGPDNRYQTINARAETVADKPTYREAFRERRCLIPTEGFYEWRQEGRSKQPYLIRRSDGQPFALAGLWERWRDPEGTEGQTPIESCTILVTDANAALRPLHERMPVVLPPETYAEWLDPANRHRSDLLALLRPAPDRDWTYEPVSRRVNRPANDDASLIEPLGEPESSSTQARGSSDA